LKVLFVSYVNFKTLWVLYSTLIWLGKTLLALSKILHAVYVG